MTILAAMVLATAFAAVDLRARTAVRLPEASTFPTSIERVRVDRAGHRTASGDRDIGSASPAGSARERPWSPAPIAFPEPAGGEPAAVHAPSLDHYDPTRPGPAPNPFVEPEQHLTRDDTRAGLDSAE